MRLEVRCCCTPKNLIGWLEVPEGATAFRAVIEPEQFALPGLFDHYPAEFVTLKVDYYSPGRDLGSYPALKGEGVSAEKLRRIRGLILADPGHSPNT